MDDDLKKVLGEVLVESLLDVGLSVRNVADSVEKVEEALLEKGVLSSGISGISRAAVGRRKVDIGEARLWRLENRRFDDEPIVAAFIDGTAIGAKGKKDTVMIVVGVTAEGDKRALGIGIANGENSKDIGPWLKEVVEQRGVDPGILWVTDQGGGIRVALTSLTTAEKRHIQLCTTHAARNVVKHLDEADASAEEQKKFLAQLYEAWEPEDADTAREKLTELVAELQEKHYDTAAKSLKESIEGTITVQKLGLTGAIRRQMRTTNPQESINRGVKSVLGDVTLWRILKDENGEEVAGTSEEVAGTGTEVDGRSEKKVAERYKMLLRQVASRLIYLEEERWNRLANPEQLVELMSRLGLERDPEKILARLPPSISVARLPVTLGDDEGMLEVATRWCEEHPEAIPIGSPETLDALGLTGKALTPTVLVDAMRSRDPKTGAIKRPTYDIAVETRDAEGAVVKAKAKGLLNLKWELAASPSAMREWHEGGAAREQAEAKMLRAASAAVERLTLTTERHHGFAAVAALQRPAAESPDQPLRVSGIAFAVQRGRGADLKFPPMEEMLRSATARAAEDAAKAVLGGDGAEVTAAAAGVVPGRDVAPEQPVAAPGVPPPVSRELLAVVKARALELAPRMVVEKREELEARAARFAEAGDGLGAVAGEVREWREADWKSAARQIAAAGMRPGPASSPHQGIWGPLGRGERAVLGEKDSQWLLGEAALAAGFAEGDAAVARDLHEAGEDALAGLRKSVDRVQDAAEALAARRELARRRQFEAAREGGAREASAPPALRDSRGELAAAPVDRYRHALGADRAAALDRYARAVAPEMRRMDDDAVRRLAARTTAAWTELDPAAGMRLARLERDRDAVLGERLRALREVGRETAHRERAERRRDTSAFFAADDRVTVAKVQARGHWERLRELEGQVATGRDVEGNPESLIEDHPEAAIHHAAHAELSRRELAREVSPPTPEPTPAIEAPVGIG
ncbi:MAG: transposase [Actinobacteria bacterium]|nr:transposase [Actinomycetota bacterium]